MTMTMTMTILMFPPSNTEDKGSNANEGDEAKGEEEYDELKKTGKVWV